MDFFGRCSLTFDHVGALLLSDMVSESSCLPTTLFSQRLTFIRRKSLQSIHDVNHIFEVDAFLGCSKADQRATTFSIE